MNFTTEENNVTGAGNYMDRLVQAIGRNVTVVVLGITINYINATMVYTFNKHYVCKIMFLLKRK